MNIFSHLKHSTLKASCKKKSYFKDLKKKGIIMNVYSLFGGLIIQ